MEPLGLYIFFMYKPSSRITMLRILGNFLLYKQTDESFVYSYWWYCTEVQPSLNSIFMHAKYIK